MNGLITTDEHFDKDAVIASLRQYTVSGVVKRVSRKEKVIYKSAAFEPTDLEQAQMGVLADASMLAAIAEAKSAGVSNGLIAMYADQGAFGAEKLAQLTSEKRTADRNGTAIRTKHIALLDYGAKSSIIHCLGRRGCDVTVYPCDTPAQTIIDDRPDGIMLSNGPGDPAECVEIIEQIKALCASDIPIFAICLGHQLLALAHGFETAKLKYGHRGANHPVKDIRTGRVYMSSQNHGYVVVPESVDPEVAEVTFVNANDGTVEGIAYKNARISSVQFHPEASGGPKDTEFLFDAFLEK
jgi:carbamoyl-phosphate synthase small subunit